MNPDSLPSRMRSKVRVSESGCWIWTASHDKQGYGRFDKALAHRYAYKALVGPIPEGLELDHLCRVRDCIRPDHLEPVTHAENVRRSPIVTARSETCQRGLHAMTEDNVIGGPGRRRECRACKLEYQKAYQAAYHQRNKDQRNAYHRARYAELKNARRTKP